MVTNLFKKNCSRQLKHANQHSHQHYHYKSNINIGADNYHTRLNYTPINIFTTNLTKLLERIITAPKSTRPLTLSL